MNRPTTIEGYSFELYKEYDRANLVKLSYKGQVQWFKSRVNLVLMNPLTVLADDSYRVEFRKHDGDILLSFGTLICCGIEALGGFLKGRASYKAFKSFILTYMDSRWRNSRPDGIPYWKALREDFRNGLAHGFTVDRGCFEASDNYFEMKPYGLEIDEKKFFADLKQAFDRYMNDLMTAPAYSALRRNFQKRFKDIFVEERPLQPRPSIFKRIVRNLASSN